jgi:16S rRNA processing protein RimM
LKFAGVDDISGAEALSGADVCIPLQERPAPPPGEYFHTDLVGCEVLDVRTGRLLGKVSAWLDAGGPGLLELDSGMMVPFARSICFEIDVSRRRILVDLPEGLEQLNRP